jgi:hypothetical protein
VRGERARGALRVREEEGERGEKAQGALNDSEVERELPEGDEEEVRSQTVNCCQTARYEIEHPNKPLRAC